MYIPARLIFELVYSDHPVFCCVYFLKVLEGYVRDSDVGVAHSVKAISARGHLSSLSKFIVRHLVHDTFQHSLQQCEAVTDLTYQGLDAKASTKENNNTL